MDEGKPLWWNWCRLCARQEYESNFDILMDECLASKNSNYEALQQALHKYFCINLSSEDNMPISICADCNTYISSLTKFAEHVKKVQLMFAQLVEIDDYSDIKLIRTRFLALDDFKHNKNVPVPTTEISHIKYSIKQETVGIGQMDYDEEPLEFDIPEDGDDPFATMDDYNAFKVEDHSQEEPIKATRKRRTRNQTNQNKEFYRHRKKQSVNYDSDCSIKNESASNRSCTATILNNLIPEEAKEIHLKSKEIISYKTIQGLEKWNTDSNESDRSESVSKVEINNKTLITRNSQKQININRRKKVEIPIDYTMDAACAECEEKFFLFSKYSDHMLTSHVNNQWKCVTCNRALQSRYDFERHLRKHLPKNSIIKHICTICGLKLSCSTTLNRHLAVHSDKMQHLCEHCGRAFKRDTTLKAHMILHTGLKPYSCNFCQLSFACSSNCRRHMRKAHSEEFAALQTFGNKAQRNEAV